MKFLMQEQAKEYPDIELTVFVGDLQQGVELARRNFYNDYDVIISRGGTATKLRERLDLPVVEVPILPYDIMRAMKLAENVSSHYAIVGFPNVTASAQILCQLMQHRIDIYTVQDADQVEPVLKSIQRSGTRAILCDMVAHTAATRLGLDAVLITSGAEGIHAAFAEARRLYRNYRLLREENRFLRSLIWNQINHTVVFSDQGELFFSTLKDYRAPILDFLREESRDGRKDTRQHILKQIHNVQYSIRLRHETVDGKEYTAYYFSESRVPSADIQRGIRYEGMPEAEEQYSNSLYGIVGLLRDLQDKMTQINRSEQPVMIFGEDGTCKEQAVHELYLQSSRREHPLVIIDCFMLNEKVWNYLMDYHNSPFAHSGCTIFLKNVDVLTPEQRHGRGPAQPGVLLLRMPHERAVHRGGNGICRKIVLSHPLSPSCPAAGGPASGHREHLSQLSEHCAGQADLRPGGRGDDPAARIRLAAQLHPISAYFARAGPNDARQLHYRPGGTGSAPPGTDHGHSQQAGRGCRRASGSQSDLGPHQSGYHPPDSGPGEWEPEPYGCSSGHQQNDAVAASEPLTLPQILVP